MRELKTVPLTEFKADGEGAGTFEGRASTFGTVDAYGDTVDAGAYKETIPQFLQRGFIGWGHDWMEPIGLLKSAEERDDGLWITGKFHSDPDAQRVRTIARERLDEGKFMGLSIGYEAEEYEMREVDPPVRNKYGELSTKVRALTKIKLYEVSLVTVPAEANSGLSMVKGYGYEIPLTDHAFSTKVQLEELVARFRSVAGPEAKVGRALRASTRSLIESVSGALRVHAEDLAKLLEASAEPEEDDEDDAPDPVVGLGAPPADEKLRALVARQVLLDARYGG